MGRKGAAGFNWTIPKINDIIKRLNPIENEVLYHERGDADLRIPVSQMRQTGNGNPFHICLGASDAEIACECGGSVLRTEYDGRTTVYVPCGLCSETHMAICPPDRMLRGATALACSQTKQFCCFIGPEGIVEKNLRELVILAEKEKQQQEEPEALR